MLSHRGWLRSGQTVTLREWHVVHASRTGRLGLLTLDEQSTSVEGISPGRFTQLTLVNRLFVGGCVDWKQVFHSTGVNRSFRGCIQLASTIYSELQVLYKAAGAWSCVLTGVVFRQRRSVFFCLSTVWNDRKCFFYFCGVWSAYEKCFLDA